MSPSLREEILSLPALFRNEIRPLLPERAFLRRDRDAGLFITNAAQFADVSMLTDELHALGFTCACAGGFLRISPDKTRITAFELRHEPPDHFCKTLVRFRGMPPCDEAAALFARGVQLIENPEPGRLDEYMKQTRRLAALSLRNRQGGVYACALIAHILETERSIPL